MGVSIYSRRTSEDVTVIPYAANSTSDRALRDVPLNTGEVYSIWYANEEVQGFKMIHSDNSIEIFQYVP